MRRAPLPPCLAFLCVLAAVQAAAQQPSPTGGPQPPAPAAPAPVEGTGGFRAIRLGMSLDEVKAALQQDPYFNYRGDPDVSFLPLSEQTLIECGGTSYIERAYFQFSEKRLFTITLMIDASQIDHYSLLARLTEKYGPHSELNPSRVLWHFAAVDFSLERPLTVRYIDRKAFEAQRTRGTAKEALDDISRRRFLEQF